MRLLSALLILAAADFSVQHPRNNYSDRLEWPEEYHFSGEEISLDTGIVKPFEIWHSTKQRKSRIDLFGGTIRRYYHPSEKEYHRGKIYMIHPQVSEDDSKNEIICDVMPRWGYDEDFLPSLYNFEFKGTEKHAGKDVQVWKKSETKREILLVEETLLIEELKEGVGIPLHHYKKTWNLVGGSLKEDTVINYYNYASEVSEKDMEVTEQNCDRDRSFTDDFYEAVKVLHPAIKSDVDYAFDSFKKHHSRDYEDEEHHFRKAIFKQNWDMIVHHNSKKLSYTLGLNQFADKTMEELSYLSGVKSRYDRSNHGTEPYPYTDSQLEEMVKEFPATFDLRTEGVISAVKNQAKCGSCWAFAVTATVEGTLARANGGRLIDLSEQSLVDCAWAFSSHGCQGTMAVDAPYKYVMKHGIPTEEEYGTYMAEDGVCNVKNMTKTYNITGYVSVPTNNPNALKAALFKHGPVTIGIFVTRAMIFYKSGIFYDFDCDEYPIGRHAVTVIGYGDQYGDLYWIVKNSWGEAWGESGYILMAANGNNCKVMSYPFYPVM